MLGSALARSASRVGIDVLAPGRNVVDLRDIEQLRSFLNINKPDAVIHAAALVGGISANIARPIEFLSKNIEIDNHVLQACDEFGVERLIYMASSCMYPKDLQSPMRVEELFSGKLEPTNEGYALAKLVGTKHVQYVAEKKNVAWRVFIPSNLYGPSDHFDPDRSHLLAAIIYKVVEAKVNDSSVIQMWGDGSARREFTFVEDLADFTVASLESLQVFPPALNVGSGVDHSISEYYGFVMDALNVRAELEVDLSKPVGMSQKLLDIKVAKSHGWEPKTDLKIGLAATINWYLQSNKIILPHD
jgi:GDP-L-fucose synthase